MLVIPSLLLPPVAWLPGCPVPRIPPLFPTECYNVTLGVGIILPLCWPRFAYEYDLGAKHCKLR